MAALLPQSTAPSSPSPARQEFERWQEALAKKKEEWAKASAAAEEGRDEILAEVQRRNIEIASQVAVLDKEINHQETEWQREQRTMESELQSLADRRAKNDERIAKFRVGMPSVDEVQSGVAETSIEGAAVVLQNAMRGTKARREVDQMLMERGGPTSQSFPSLSSFGLRTAPSSTATASPTQQSSDVFETPSGRSAPREGASPSSLFETPAAGSVGGFSDGQFSSIPVLPGSEGGPSTMSQSLRSVDYGSPGESDIGMMSGWLRRKPEKTSDLTVKRTWQKVWVKLVYNQDDAGRCSLLYFADETEQDQVDRIELHDCAVEHDSKGKYDQYGKCFIFAIRRPGKKKESIMAASEEERAQWSNAIEHSVL